MSNELLIASAVLADAATLSTTSPTAAGQGIAKLQTLQPGDPCRFTDGADAHVVIDFGAGTPPAVNFVGGLAIIGADADDTWRVRAAASEAGLTSAPSYDSTTVNIWAKAGLDNWPFHHAALFLSPTRSYRYWRLDFTSDAAIDVGRLMIDAAYVSPRAVDVVFKRNERDPTLTRRGQSGALFVVAPGEIWREPEYTISAQTRAQLLAAWQPLIRKVGRRLDVFAWLDPGTATFLQEEAVHALIETAEDEPVFAPDFHRARIRFAEMLPNIGIGAV